MEATSTWTTTWSRAQNVAGDPHGSHWSEQGSGWDGLTQVQIHDQNRWEKVLLPDSLPEGQTLTINMLKRSILAKVNLPATKEIMQGMRVYFNDGGIPSGLPLKGTDTAWAHKWYTVVISKDASIIVMTSGEDVPSPDSNTDITGWEDVVKTA
eukprot:8410614-Pyramimonas_sp.AAC.1